MIRFLYSLVGILLTPLITLWLLKRAARGKESFARLRERFGHAAQMRPPGTLIWLHAASVGEAQSIFTLVRALLAQQPEASVLITTGTVTSAALVAQQHLPRTIHQFVPIDTYQAVRRFLRHWRPDMVLWVESEFWPQMLWRIKKRRIPALLINARISDGTAANWRKWPRTIRSLLGCFRSVYAGSKEDAARLATLGAKQVHDAGNLKYDAAALPVDETAYASLKQIVGSRRVWVAASTHANEEQRIAEVHAKLATQFHDLLTIIVPRHATRGDAIAADLRGRHLTLAQRSKHEDITPETGIYLADTMGELGLFYRLSEIVFLGGSLIAHGGHNPLEAAQLNCAILSGPFVHNFAGIVAHLQTAHAIRIVRDPGELQVMVALLLRDKGQRHDLAARAADVVKAAQGASEKILREIDQLLRSA
jgi:3-deoxy-D-manno-octulosonic-acid transferase